MKIPRHLLVIITFAILNPCIINAQTQGKAPPYADPSRGMFPDPNFAQDHGSETSTQWSVQWDYSDGRSNSSFPDFYIRLLDKNTGKLDDVNYCGWVHKGDVNAGSYLLNRRTKKIYRWYQDSLTEVAELPERRLADDYGLHFFKGHNDGFERVECTIKPMTGGDLLKLRIKGVDHLVMRALNTSVDGTTENISFFENRMNKAYLEKVKKDGDIAFTVYDIYDEKGGKQAIIFGTFSPFELGAFNPDLQTKVSTAGNDNSEDQSASEQVESKYEECIIKPGVGIISILSIKGVDHKVIRALPKNATKEMIDYFDNRLPRQMYLEKVKKGNNDVYIMYMVVNGDNGGKAVTILNTVTENQLGVGKYDIDVLSH